jgi:hypothetical protein
MSDLRDKHLPNFKDIDCKGKTQLTAFENCLMRIINKLAGEGVVMCDEYEKKIEQLCTERDEARRQFCEFEMVNIKCAHDCANRYGWDCYKKETL